MTQAPPGAWVASVNDCSPAVVPTPQWMVIDEDEHDDMADRLTVPSAGAVVDGGGTVVVATIGSSSSMVVTATVLSETES